MNQAIRKAQSTRFSDPRFASLEKSTFTKPPRRPPASPITISRAGAKLLFPVLTPLRNSIPRVSGKGGVQAAWRAITAINSSGLRVGVSGGNRGGVAAMTTKDYIANYKGIGIETSVDFEAQYAGQNFDDIRALAAQTGLEALMLGEEAMILGGNTSLALGATATPTLAASTTGGSLATRTLSVIAVALTLDGLMNASVVTASRPRSPAPTPMAAPTHSAAARRRNPPMPPSPSPAPTGSVSASRRRQRRRLGYAWFWGAAGSEVLGAITTINSRGHHRDRGGNADGGLAARAPTGRPTRWPSTACSPRPSFRLRREYHDPADGRRRHRHAADRRRRRRHRRNRTVLKANWDNYRLSPDEVWVSSQEACNISKKILAGGTSAAQRFIFDATSQERSAAA